MTFELSLSSEELSELESSTMTTGFLPFLGFCFTGLVTGSGSVICSVICGSGEVGASGSGICSGTSSSGSKLF